ncbi:hypothetical protein C1708_30410 [Streptomyces sp. DH-12]|uniref:hypothetical protein n=1 Tax=unclassified Streptomyces TaxID=2593676 RepID=UPI000CCE2234|nr:hypothetical protein [Streptomyces sp. DH-12]PNV36098.1 hypothetical protein C1708_30410 [Streptomyces sp. DH-12]
MTEQNKNANQKTSTAGSTASKAKSATAQAADKTTESAKSAADGVAGKAADATSAAASGTQRAARAANGAAQSAVKGVEAGRRAVVTASGQVAAGAKTAWTVIANRRLVAAGAAAGLTALTAASYAVGRRAERHTHGPLTRMTGGRI